MKYAQVLLHLTHAEVILAVYGAREFQENPKLDLSATARYALSEGQCLLTHTGAKMYKQDGDLWRICGYGYPVRNNVPDIFDGYLAVDERDTLRTLGFAA